MKLLPTGYALNYYLLGLAWARLEGRERALREKQALMVATCTVKTLQGGPPGFDSQDAFVTQDVSLNRTPPCPAYRNAQAP